MTQTDSTPVLALRDLRKSFGKVEVIHGVDLEIAEREFVVFVGPSGCGKSTLLRMIAGLETTTSGEIVIDGATVNRVPAAERGLAMVFQSYALYPHMTVRQNMAFSLENERRPKAEIAKQVEMAARMLQIEPLLDRKPKQMSGGQRQRVAIGRAIVRNPRIFLFDEPLSNLDADLRTQTRNELAQLHRQIDATMIYVTHDQVEAMTLADRIVVLNGGRIEQVGKPLDLYARPRTRFVARFIGSPRMNVLPASIETCNGGRANISVCGAAIEVERDPSVLSGRPPVEVGFRPEHLSLSDAGIAFTVQSTEALGVETFIHGKTDIGDHDLTIRIPGLCQHHNGDRLFAEPSVENVHIFHADEQGLAIR